MLTCLDPRGALSGADQVGQGIPVTLLRRRRKTPNPSLCHRGRAEGGPPSGGDAGRSRVVLGGSSVSPPTTLCAFHPSPRSDSSCVSVIPPTTGPLHMFTFFFFFDQQVVIKHLLCPKHRQFSGKQGTPLASRGLPDYCRETDGEQESGKEWGQEATLSGHQERLLYRGDVSRKG